MILLLICFVSLFFVLFRMVSLPIDFVSHPKIPFSLRSETSETGGSVSLFREKKFRYVSLQFRFEAKFGDTLIIMYADTKRWMLFPRISHHFYRKIANFVNFLQKKWENQRKCSYK